MKRVYLILTLFMTSFFLFSIKEVKADTYTYDINPTFMDYINEEFLKLREETIKYCTENNINYIISYKDNKLTSYISSFNTTSFSDFKYKPRLLMYNNYKKFALSSGAFIEIGNGSNLDLIFHDTNLDVNYLLYLDTNLELLNNSGIDYIFKFNDLDYVVNQGDKLPTLYDMYLDSKPDEPIVSDKFTEEQEIINNFYSTTFTKIGDLATTVANNYIFLIIFGIFILIFVFELIRSRLL